MAVNRYDTPAQSQFINTYVPIPFEQMVGAGQVQQGRYDQTAAAMDQQQAFLDSVQAIPDSVDEDYVSKLRGEFQNVADEFSQKDLANPIVRRQLNSRIRRSVDSDRLRDIQNSFQGYQARNKGLAQLRARGEYNDLLESGRDPALQGRYDSRTGTYQYLPQSYKDPTLALRDVFNDPHYMAGRDLGSKGGFYYSGRDETDFDNTLDAIWQDFAGTIDGQNVIDQHLALNPNSDATDEQIIKGWANSKRDAFTFARRGPKVEQLEGPDKENLGDGFPRLYDSSYISKAGHGKRSHRNIPSVEEITGARVEGEGFIKRAGKWVAKVSPKNPLVDDSERGDIEVKEAEVVGGQEEIAAYEDLKKRAQFYFGEGSFEGLNNKDQHEKIQEYVDDFYNKGTSINVQPVTTEEGQEELRNLMFDLNKKGNIEATNMAVHDPDNPITGEYASFDEYVDEYPLNEYKYIPIGRISSDNPLIGDKFASGYQVEIWNTDDEGNATTSEKIIYVGGEKYSNLGNSFAHSVHSAAHNLQPITTVRGSLPLLDDPTTGKRRSTKIEGQIGRRDYRGPDGRMYHEFMGEFSFIGENGKSQTITIGAGGSVFPNSTDDLLKELRDRILSVDKDIQ